MKIKIEFESEEEKQTLLEVFRHSYRDDTLTLEQVEDLILKQSTKRVETSYLTGAIKKARLEGKALPQEIHKIRSEAKSLFNKA